MNKPLMLIFPAQAEALADAGLEDDVQESLKGSHSSEWQEEDNDEDSRSNPKSTHRNRTSQSSRLMRTAA